MKIGFDQNIYNYKQIVVTILFGIIGAAIQTPKSNIHPLLGAVLLGSFMSKSLFGDWDKKYNWTISDVFYWITAVAEAGLGGFIGVFICKYITRYF